MTASATAPSAPVLTGTGAGWLLKGAVVVAALALLMAVWMWQRLDRIQQELARREMTVTEQSNRSKEMVERTEALTQELQARLAVAEVKLSEVSLQRTQLEELIQQLSRSRDENVLADVDAAVRVAVQQSAITGSAEPLAQALRQREERLARMNQPRVERVRRALARDLDRVRAARSESAAMLERVDGIHRSLGNSIRDIADCGRAIDASVAEAVRSLQFEDIVTQALGSAERHLERLEAINRDATGLQQTLALSGGASASRKLDALNNLHRRLRELRDAWEPVPHKPVSQVDMGAGSVDLF